MPCFCPQAQVPKTSKKCFLEIFKIFNKHESFFKTFNKHDNCTWEFFKEDSLPLTSIMKFIQVNTIIQFNTILEINAGNNAVQYYNSV